MPDEVREAPQVHDAAKAGDPAQECLELIAFGVHHRKFGDAGVASKTLAAAYVIAQKLYGASSGPDPLRALAMLNLSLMARDPVKNSDARRLREQAVTLLPSTGVWEQVPEDMNPVFQELMAGVLTEVGEHRRAIPYCEALVQCLGEPEAAAPAGLAVALQQTGNNYLKIGLRDHAAIHLRAAVKAFRRLTEDPRLSAALLNLGNALRKSTPQEAESCYRESAAIHEARAHLESACPAWVNLGVLYSELGRPGEALENYQKALRVRERSPGVPADRLGVLHNNIANAHRRMSNFAEAHRAVERAIKLLEPSAGPSLANAYGTTGLILRDEGRDAEAVEWFRKSSAEHRKRPSPDLATLCEELENEAAALTRLGRSEEAADVEAGLASVRSQLAAFAAAGAAPEDTANPEAGAVLIELNFGSRKARFRDNPEVAALELSLRAAACEDESGRLNSHVSTPEAITIMFYGDDSEALYRSLEPVLASSPLCAGARIIVRQGTAHREVLLPQPLM